MTTITPVGTISVDTDVVT